ncbi:MAG: hypothetical protein WBP34_04060 [Thermoanaerobaculia bacterium]
MTAAESTGTGARPKVPIHLWIVGVLALLWNFMGAFDYLATQLKLASYMGQFTQEQLDYFYGIPAWAVSGWAIAVWIGLVGTVGLLLRRKWSVLAFAVSLAGLAISSIYTLILSDGLKIMGGTGTIMTVLIWVISIFLVWYSKQQAKAGVLT